jgi:hypothetical protein
MINRSEILKCMNSELCKDCKSSCNEVKTYANWETDLSEYLQIGNIVDDEMVEYAYNVLPPATMNGSMVQIGEPYSHREDETGKWRATYATFVKTEAGWTYAGHCFRGRYENIN